MQKLIFLPLLLLGMVGCKTLDNAHADDTKKDKILSGMRVAILVTDGFEQIEMTAPRKALEEAGAKTVLIGPKSLVQGYNHDKLGKSFKVDLLLDQAHAQNFQALLLPGGVKNPDSLRINPQAIQFIKSIGQEQKPIAAICHGPWTLIDADLVRNKTLTSWPSLKQDLQNAGAHWVDQEVVVDMNLVTSRKPEDIKAFNKAMIELFSKSQK